jgi:hypothetical protein
VRDIEAAFTDETGRTLLTRTAVSEITERLWADYEAFATRELSEHPVIYLFVDGAAERLRPGPRPTPEKRPMVSGAKPAIGARPGRGVHCARSERVQAWGQDQSDQSRAGYRRIMCCAKSQKPRNFVPG